MAEKVFDPVCHMAVTPETGVGFIAHSGNTYFFCSLACLNSFSENPSVFVN
jgi:P-type Cu+ transporter